MKRIILISLIFFISCITAFAAPPPHGNGANCSAGSYPLGVDAMGAVEDCTSAATANITPVDTAEENVTFYPIVVDGATGSQVPETDNEYFFNPFTDILTVPFLDMNPGGAGTNTVIDIVPTAPLTTANSEWDGIHIDGGALDPSANAIGNEIHGIHVDLSGVLRTYSIGAEPIHLAGPLAADVPGQYEPGTAAHLVGKLRVDFDSTQSVTGRTFTGVEVVVDTTGTTGGMTHAIDVSTGGGGTAVVAALGTHPYVDPIHQHIGTFQATGANYAAEQTSGGTVFDDNVNGETIFVAADDTIVIGATAPFEEIQFVLTTPATKDCFLQFFYNTAVNTYVRFYPSDGTDGMTQNGTVRFTAPAGWTADGDPDAGGGAADAGYWIKIQRTRVATPGTVVVATVKTLSPTQYYWNKSGVVNIASLTSNFTIVTPQSLAAETEADITVGTEILSSVVLLTGDDDGDHDTLHLQDGITPGTTLSFIVAAVCDDTDTLIIDAETDSTCTGCSTSGIFTFDDPGDSVTLYWSGTAWFERGKYSVD